MSDFIAHTRASKYSTDPTCAVKFHVDQFAKAFFYHFCFPFSIPFIICLDGYQAFLNMFYAFMWSVVGFISIVIIPAYTWLLVVLYIIQDPSLELRGGILPAEIGVMLGLYIMRLLTISFKYAYCARCEWRRLMRVPVGESFMRNRQIMFISGWLSPPLDVLSLQLESAAARINLDVSRYFFVYDGRLETSVQHLLSVRGHVLDSTSQLPSNALGFLPNSSLKKPKQAAVEMVSTPGRPTSVVNPLGGSAADQSPYVGLDAEANLAKGRPVMRKRRSMVGSGQLAQKLLDTADACSSSAMETVEKDPSELNTGSISLEEMCIAVMLNSSVSQVYGLSWLPLVLSIAGANFIWVLFYMYDLMAVIEMDAYLFVVRIGIGMCTQTNLYVLLAFMTTACLDMVFRDKLAAFITRLTQPTVISQVVQDDGDSDANVIPMSVLNSPAGQKLEKVLRAMNGGLSSSGVDFRRYMLPPIIDMSRQVNAFAWYRMRVLLSDLGRVFQYRLALFITASAMLVLFVDVTVVLTYYVTDSGAATYCRSISADLLYLQALLLTFILIAALGFIIVTGSNANDKRALQEDSFVQAAVDIDEISRDVAVVAGSEPSAGGAAGGREQGRRASAAELAFAADKVREVLTLDAGGRDFSMGAALVHSVMERAGSDGYDDTLAGVLSELRGAASTLATLQRALKVQDETNPVMVLGMRASPALVQVLGTGISFLAGFMLQPFQAIGHCPGGLHT